MLHPVVLNKHSLVGIVCIVGIVWYRRHIIGIVWYRRHIIDIGLVWNSRHSMEK